MIEVLVFAKIEAAEGRHVVSLSMIDPMVVDNGELVVDIA